MRSLVLFVLLGCFAATKAQTVQQWGRYEISLNGPSTGNPFTDVKLQAVFTSGDTSMLVKGFYDGNGVYKIRFMPLKQGNWSYITKSNANALNNKKGAVTCIASASSNHGLVRVSDTYHFRYADGKQYYPFGTTCYSWIHQDTHLQEETLQTLAAAPFNKLRTCIFPKTYDYVEAEPELYPYEELATTEKGKRNWNFKKFNPAFFAHLEQRIDDLEKLGIEADLILFHPYDKGKWGFDEMGKENDLFYLEYITARLSSFRNVWWSMANEYDFIRSKPREVWDDYSKAVVDNDPYRHLLSIHNGYEYYDAWKSYFTHASIQNCSAVEDFGRAELLKDAYHKPVVYDEVCYEGNLAQRWGRLSGEQMLEAFWQAAIAGTYATHGETYHNEGDTIFWAEGGRLVGSSPPRIAFLRKLLEAGPGPLELTDKWRDDHTAFVDSNYYIIYFGKRMQDHWTFDIPKRYAAPAGTKYSVEIIDTWDMTITPVEQVFELGVARDYRIYDKDYQSVRLPMKPYLAIRLQRLRN